MFNNYEIKNTSEGPILILYLTPQTEFGKIKNSQPKTTLKQEIASYLKTNNIKFNGQKILLMASGLLIGACLLTSPLNKKEINSNLLFTPKQMTLVSTSELKDLPTLNKTESNNQVQEETKNNSLKPPIKEETKKPTTSTTKTPVKTPSTPTKKPSTSTPTTPPKTQTNTEIKVPSTTPNPPLTSNNTETKTETTTPTLEAKTITIKRQNGTFLTLNFEDYLIGVVAAEMPASFHSEALKAQSIAARTYALKALENNQTLTDDVKTQSFKDTDQLKKQWGQSYATYYNKIKNAVLATKDLVMTYNNKLINAYYHSTSNGYTEDSTAVFGSYPYLQSVESLVDTAVSSYEKTVTFTYEEISSKLGIPLTPLSTISLTKNNSNRVDTIIIDTVSFSGVKFRTLLGLRSTDFTLTLNENNVTIMTHGYGHGVGMSQYGAHEYAKKGYTYEQILKHYYTGISLTKY